MSSKAYTGKGLPTTYYRLWREADEFREYIETFGELPEPTNEELKESGERLNESRMRFRSRAYANFSVADGLLNAFQAARENPKTLRKLIVTNHQDSLENGGVSKTKNSIKARLETHIPQLQELVREEVFGGDSREKAHEHVTKLFEELSPRPDVLNRLAAQVDDSQQRAILQELRKQYEAVLYRFSLPFFPVVANVVKRYRNPLLSYLELMHEGTNGLLIASERFQVHRGYAFKEYAEAWVRRVLVTRLAKMHNIPEDVYSCSRLVYRAIEVCTASGIIHPTIDDIIDKFPKKKKDGSPRKPPKKALVELAWKYLTKIPNVELDREAGTDREDAFLPAKFIEDPTSPTIGNQSTRTELQATLLRLASKLPDDERDILIQHFALVDDQPKQLRDLAIDRGEGSDKTRQILKRALRRIRRMPGNESLMPYMKPFEFQACTKANDVLRIPDPDREYDAT